MGFRGGDTNLYGYAQEDPINATDPAGTCPWCVGALIGAAWDLGSQILNNKLNGCGAFDDINWGSVAGSAALGALGGSGWRMFKTGREFSFGKNFRIAPFGNRTGHPTGRFPHYHRRVLGPDGKTVPGGSINRHRPWDTRTTDRGWTDRL